MNKKEYRLVLAMMGLIIELKTHQILILRTLSSGTWGGDEKQRQQIRNALARDETQLEQAEFLLQELKASAEE